ncbi:MCE family protein [Ectothiorhodospiraceae bacterium 2226]|nr:MCE family protein [Ectothiorhodospiraceae bacterium 2226]
MEPRAHHVLIGLFTVLIVAGLLWFGLWLAGGGLERETDYYDVVFSEEVSGLTAGSSVLYNGIRVGEVARLALHPNDPRLVVARIRVQPDTPVREDTRAELGLTAIVTGTYHVALSGGSPQSPPLRAPARQVPVIMAHPSPIARLRRESDELIDGVGSLVLKANQLLSDENLARFSQVLENIERTTGVLAEQQDHLREGMQGLARAGDRLDHTLREAAEAMQQAQALLGNANRLFDEHGEAVLGSATRAIGSLERSAGNIEALLAEHEDALGGAMEGLGEVAPAIHDLRSTLAALRDLTRRIEEDPSGALLRRDSVRGFSP